MAFRFAKSPKSGKVTCPGLHQGAKVCQAGLGSALGVCDDGFGGTEGNSCQAEFLSVIDAKTPPALRG